MELANLRDLFVKELQDLYDAENQIIEALPQMAQAASTPELGRAFQEHLEQTREHVTRLEQIFEKLGQKAGGEQCKGMQGLIAEGQKLMKEKAEPAVLDAGLIAAAQKVEHYEIAGYGTARTYAEQLDDDETADLLQTTLDEEYDTDDRLTELAEDTVNVEAAEGEESEE